MASYADPRLARFAPAEFPIAALLRAGRDQDEAGLFDVALASGLVHDAEVTPQELLALVDPLLEPLRHETFHFTAPWLRSLTARVSDPRSSASRAQRRLHLPVRNLLVQRVMAGTTGVLCLLEANVPLRGEAATWLPQLDAQS